MKRTLSYVAVLLVFLISTVGECRVGGGRSFGNRGSRSLGLPRGSSGSTYRSYQAPHQSYGSSAGSQSAPHSYTQPGGYQRPSFLRSFGAGLAGGLVGNMLFRSLGWGGGHGVSENYGGSGGSGGFGFLEILIFGALLYWLYRKFVQKRAASSPSSNFFRNGPKPALDPNSDDAAAHLMREARARNVAPLSVEDANAGPTIQKDEAMDLFFKVQAAWANRDLSSVNSLLDLEAKTYLDQEIARLKAARQMNRLENIAVRNVEVVESWNEMGKNFATVRLDANLLDFTLDEDTKQVVDGSKTTPVRFEEFWTFSRQSGNPQWKLSAIEQV